MTREARSVQPTMIDTLGLVRTEGRAHHHRSV
jgi:hypothetical protein